MNITYDGKTIKLERNGQCLFEGTLARLEFWLAAHPITAGITFAEIKNLIK